MAKILGTFGDDSLVGIAAGDQVYGLAGNDTLFGELSVVSLFGGAGNDEVGAVFDSVDSDINLLVDGGFNDDFVGIRTTSTGFFDVETGDTSNSIVTANGGAGNDSVLIFQYGQSFTDTESMTFTATASGGDGADLVGAGTYVEIDAGMVVEISQNVSASGGDDAVVSETQLAFDANSSGGSGVIGVVAAGGGGNDIISVSSLATSLADTFAQLSITANGGFGNDSVDVFATATGSGSAVIYVDVVGDIGSDIITVAATAQTSGYNGVFTDVDAGNGNDFVDVTMIGNDMVGTATGGYGNDEMRIGMVDSGVDGFATIVMDGGIGNDTVLGDLGTLFGNSTVSGDFGNDLISVAGGDGNVLRGGAGNDTMTGGALADTFAFGIDAFDELADGFRNRDVITNYRAEQNDVLDLTNGIAQVESWRVNAGNTELTMVGDHDLVILQNVVITSLDDLLFA